MGESKEYITYPDEKGSINISEEVVAVIAANAAVEVDGVACLSASIGKDIAELLGKKNLSRGVKIHIIEEGQIRADVYVMVKMGCTVSEVGEAVQAAVMSAVESMTGLKMTSVNVHVSGIAMARAK